MKYIKPFNEATQSDVTTFFLDFGMFLTMNLAKIEQYAIDEAAKKELTEMLFNLRKPILNGKTFSEINIYECVRQPKMLSALMSIVKSYIEYIEPRIEKFTIVNDTTKIWLDKLKDFKTRYLQIIKP